MHYLVRTKDGQLRFKSADEIGQALRAGLVGLEDEVLVPGATEWMAVAEKERGRPLRFW